MNALYAYIRKRTFKAGGIEKSTTGKDESRFLLENVSAEDSRVSLSDAPLESAEMLRASFKEDGIDDDVIARTTGKDDASADKLISEFTKKISELEKNAETDSAKIGAANTKTALEAGARSLLEVFG